MSTKKLLFERMHIIGGMPLKEDNIPNINIEKIITHGGAFHADEIIGITLFKKIVNPSVTVERKFNVSEEEYENPNILVLDVGKKYDPEKSNLDHHQDGKLPASNILLYGWINKYSGKSINNNSLHSHFVGVSDCDIGKVICKDDTFNAKIRFLNSVENGYEHALKLSEYVVNNLLNGKKWYDSPEAMKIINFADETKKNMDIESEKLWNDPSVFKKEGRIAYRVNPDSKIPRVNWQNIEANKSHPILYTLVGKGRDNNGYGVIAFDSKKNPIIPNEYQTFLHNNGFYAIYDTMENAINHMREMSNS